MHRILPVIIVASDICLVLRFFADRTAELMRAIDKFFGCSSTMFSRRAFPLCYLFYSFASIFIASLVLRCFSCLAPIIVYLAADILPTFHHLLPCFVCESCLSFASRSALLRSVVVLLEIIMWHPLHIKLLSWKNYKVAPVGNSWELVVIPLTCVP